MTDVLTICYLTMTSLCWYHGSYSCMSFEVSRNGVAWLLIAGAGFKFAAVPLFALIPSVFKSPSTCPIWAGRILEWAGTCCFACIIYH